MLGGSFVFAQAENIMPAITKNGISFFMIDLIAGF
jgi:hypothetical protein